jgi:hypothetical protein
LRRSLLFAAAVALLAAAACRASAPAIDVRQLGAEGRIARAPLPCCRTWGLDGPIRSDGRVYAWEGGEVLLRSVSVGGVLRPRKRLLVDARDARGRETTFLVDTGTSSTTLSTADPLYAGAIVDPSETYASYGERMSHGCLGLLDELRMGTLVGRQVVVALVQRPSSAQNPSTILGMEHLQGLVLRHRAGRWSLVNRATAVPDPRSVAVPLEAPGLPIVRVRAPSGAEVFALLDTGAPEGHAVPPNPRGTYAIVDGAGRTLLPVPVSRTFDAPGLRAGGRPVALLAGLDALETVDFDLDLAGAVLRVVPR